MISTSYRLGDAANKRFIVHGPEAISRHEAQRRYCVVFHPEIKNVSTIPFWFGKILATVTRNHKLRSVVEMMSYFEKTGEGSHPPTDNSVLGAPATTLDVWLEQRNSRNRQIS